MSFSCARAKAAGFPPLHGAESIGFVIESDSVAGPMLENFRAPVARLAAIVAIAAALMSCVHIPAVDEKAAAPKINDFAPTPAAA